MLISIGKGSRDPVEFIGDEGDVSLQIEDGCLVMRNIVREQDRSKHLSFVINKTDWSWFSVREKVDENE